MAVKRMQLYEKVNTKQPTTVIDGRTMQKVQGMVHRKKNFKMSWTIKQIQGKMSSRRREIGISGTKDPLVKT